MKEKESGPEPMWLYVNPVLTELNYVEMRKEAIPTPREAQVWFQLDGKRESACVPLHTVNEQRQTVTAALVGECQGKIVVSFPPHRLRPHQVRRRGNRPGNDRRGILTGPGWHGAARLCIKMMRY